MTQLTIQQAFELAVRHQQAGRFQEAEQLYRQILMQQPHAHATLNLGVLAHQLGHDEIALELFRRAVATDPQLPEAQINLGNALREVEQLDEAIVAYRKAIALRPGLPEAYNNLGIALKDRGQFDKAIAACREAITLRPNYAEAYNSLGVALKEKGEHDEAIAACRHAIALEPDNAEACNNLGIALHDKRQFDEAIVALRQAVALKSSFAEAYSNLGIALQDVGQLDEAITAYRRAVVIKPKYAGAYSNLICSLNYHGGYDGRAIMEELAQWNRQHAEPLRELIQPHTNDRNPERRLRIGYVSADFRNHASAFFLMPLLKHHDRQQVEIFCYAEILRPDAKTRQFQELADAWRSTEGVSDEQVANQIREDRIDILVDLKLHTAENRLLVFARKPAPVQVTWLGYPGSTGLSTIDYRLSDPYLDPVGMDESIYTEKTVRLPDSFWCYDPLEGRDVSVNSLPAEQTGIVTFGCLNNFCKINDALLSLWARVLKQVENSRLMLLAPYGNHQQRTLDRLSVEGIDPSRIEFFPFQMRRKYLELYHHIDLGLDSIPCNGHTTSLDSFWMGVPVVTLAGQTAVRRAGWCQLSNLGMTELAARTPEQYVRIAVKLARDLPRLSELRRTLRERMERSPLMDGTKFARNIEAAYRQMWRTWCESASARS